MDTLKQLLITELRDRNSTRAQFQKATYGLAHVLAQEAADYCATQKTTVQTPLSSTHGLALKKNPMLVPILRSGIALLPTFLNYFPGASIGIVGLKRDEKTAEAQLYYDNIPPVQPDDQVIILDPMIATGGTAVKTLKILVDKDIKQENIVFVALVSAPEGLQTIRSHFEKINIIVAAQDEKLNSEKFILPGLGDFGDRYFGS